MHKQMRKNLIGEKFGKLTVIELDEDKSVDYKIYWICKCDCGNIKSIQSTSLTRNKGNVTSCGCNKNSKEAKEKTKITKNKYPRDIRGLKFGKLTVIEKTNLISNKKSDGNCNLWKCKCDCGNIVYYSRYNLISEIGVKSCGCYHKERINENKKNNYDISGEYGIGYCDNGSVFYFDIEDYDLIKEYKWNYDGRYVQSHENKNKIIRLHRLIMGLKDDKICVDHINHCTFDNRKINLRLVTHKENSWNSINNTCTRNNPIGIKEISNNNFIVNFMGKIIGNYSTFEEAFDIRTKLEKDYRKEFRYDESNDYNNTQGESYEQEK